MVFLALVVAMQADAGALETAARRIDEHPGLARMFQEQSAPFVRCGHKAMDARLASEASTVDLQNLPKADAFKLFQRAVDGAARDCGIDRHAATIARGIRAALPDIDPSAATMIARANLYQLIGFSIWGD